MSEEAAFLRAICENPDDDTARLVFADWLTEQGGPVNTAWANGIRDDVWFARGVTDAPQSRIFESSYGKEKVRERLGISSQISAAVWSRGFPCALGGDFETIAEAWPWIAFRIPCRALTLHKANDNAVSRFVTWPAISRLRGLLFTNWDGSLTDTALSTLASCSCLQQLEHVGVSGIHLTDCGAEAILDSPHLNRVHTFTLRRRRGGPELSPAVAKRLIDRFSEGVFEDIPA